MKAPSFSQLIEMRSDTFTLPTPGMLQAITQSPLGNDGYGEDPTVLKLERLAAEKVGKEASCLVPSGTMANLATVLAHCTPGVRNCVLLGNECDLYVYEGEATSFLRDLEYCPLPTQADGTLLIKDLMQRMNQCEAASQRVALVAIENPHNVRGGIRLSLEYLSELSDFAHSRGVPLHLDGARIFNAAVASGVPPSRICQSADTVQFCLSKGLSAPAGSLVAGTRTMIAKVRAIRQMLGGTMRQAGVIAAAGIIALETMIDRLAIDHRNARRLAAGLAGISGLRILNDVQTNTVVFEVTDRRFTHDSFISSSAARGIYFSKFHDNRIRAVLHCGVDSEQVDAALQILEIIFREGPLPD